MIKREDVQTKDFNDSNAFIVYSNNVNDIYKNTEIITQIKNEKY